jgi:D-alanyl-D-alanine carboxypeptidase (penicillin-binding protein 5/6)
MAALVICCNLFFSQDSCMAAVPNVTARSAILYDRNTGEILYEKNSNEQRPPASTTKIMTGIIAVEMGSMKDEVVVSRYAASKSGSSMYLREGDVFTFEDLLWGTLLRSGNDSSVALAEAVAGSETAFVELMNKKAYLLGAFNTVFKNTNGLTKKGHVSTAHDLAVITDYALDNPEFAEIVSTRQKVISKVGSNKKRILNNTNRLLSFYQGANGVKTGTTNAAGQCLVASASRNDRELISVVLRSGDRYGDSVRLLNHGFEDFMAVTIPEGTVVGTFYFGRGKPYQVDLVTAEKACFSVSKEKLAEFEKRLVVDKPDLPLKGGEKVGYLEIEANQQHRIPVAVARHVRKENTADCIIKILEAIILE